MKLTEDSLRLHTRISMRSTPWTNELLDPDECLDPDRFFNIVIILRVYLKHDASLFFLLSHFRSVCEAVMWNAQFCPISKCQPLKKTQLVCPLCKFFFFDFLLGLFNVLYHFLFFLLLVNLAPFLVPSCLVIVIVILPVFPFCYVKSCALNSFTCMSSLFNYHISRFTLRVRIPCAFPLFLLLVPCFLYDLVHLCLISTFPNYPSVYIVCVCFCSPSQWSRPLVFLVFEGLSVLSSLRFQ